ncbi:NAD(P)-binding domain-containing protein, partial [Lactiplantibacillus plantarum]
MKLGLIGLGKMGMNLALNMQDNGHTPVGMDLNPTNLSTASAHGLATATDLTNLLDQLPTPRIVWIMVPAGKATNSVIEQLAQTLSAGDIVLDGGNSHYQDSIRHGELLASHHINFLD